MRTHVITRADQVIMEDVYKKQLERVFLIYFLFRSLIKLVMQVHDPPAVHFFSSKNCMMTCPLRIKTRILKFFLLLIVISAIYSRICVFNFLDTGGTLGLVV